VEEEEVVLAKQSVRLSLFCSLAFRSFLIFSHLAHTGRVAAGTIAERYLKLAYGVEIVAFVSSVGKVHMPESSTDSDLLSEDYLKLLHGLTREDVDQNLVRCPHAETAEAMEEVSGHEVSLSLQLHPKTKRKLFS